MCHETISKYFITFSAHLPLFKEKYLHLNLCNFRDLTSWINDTKAVISQDELAKDVNGAEALLERHAEHKSEIDAREDSFRATAEAGQMLLDSGI